MFTKCLVKSPLCRSTAVKAYRGRGSKAPRADLCSRRRCSCVWFQVDKGLRSSQNRSRLGDEISTLLPEVEPTDVQVAFITCELSW